VQAWQVMTMNLEGSNQNHLSSSLKDFDESDMITTLQAILALFQGSIYCVYHTTEAHAVTTLPFSWEIVADYSVLEDRIVFGSCNQKS
jgi:hypothetical protein